MNKPKERKNTNSTYIKAHEIDEFIQIIFITIQQKNTVFNLFVFGFDRSWKESMNSKQLALFTCKCQALKLFNQSQNKIKSRILDYRSTRIKSAMYYEIL